MNSLIYQKTLSSPFLATRKIVQPTTVDSFPFHGYYQGDYRSSYPYIYDRRAGWCPKKCKTGCYDYKNYCSPCGYDMSSSYYNKYGLGYGGYNWGGKSVCFQPPCSTIYRSHCYDKCKPLPDCCFPTN